MTVIIRILVLALILFITFAATSQTKPLSQQMSETVMNTWPDSFTLAGDKQAKWRYDQGVILKGMENVWYETGDGKWFQYIQKSMDLYVQEDGTIRGYRPDEYNIDHINNGKLLILLYQVTGRDKYRKAIELLRNQLRSHPRTNEGGFWHKKIYPSQMWLDGLYMAQPFYAAYARIFHEDSIFNDVARQFILMDKHAVDKKTGLLYHGWDESREQRWANKTTGQSPHFWGRSLGWFGMALVDALEFFPADHPKRKELINILQRLATAVRKVQDTKTGVWYDIPDQPTRAKNYREASASCMLAYTMAKGARLGYLPVIYLGHAKQAWEGIQKEFIYTHASGQTYLKGTVAVSGLGGNPYRDGSFDYYMSEPVIDNDPKGLGAFILCATELERSQTPQTGKGKTILLDRYFNSEKRKDAGGQLNYWHYTWEERSHPGFALFGYLFNSHGAKLASLDNAPTYANLRKADVYIIVDPDHVKDNPAPNYVKESDASVIAEWVKAGGVLVLMGNDSSNCDLTHFNTLASKFGLRFTDMSRNMVKNDEFETGAVLVKPKHLIFGDRKMYLKELSVLETSGPAKAVVTKDGETIMAVAQLGKGTVFAVGDPWLYNEYLDGRKTLPGFNNYEAAQDLVAWLIKQSKK